VYTDRRRVLSNDSLPTNRDLCVFVGVPSTLDRRRHSQTNKLGFRVFICTARPHPSNSAIEPDENDNENKERTNLKTSGQSIGVIWQKAASPPYMNSSISIVFARQRQCAPASKTCFLGFTRVYNQNGISIGSAVFAGVMIVTDRHTDRQTTLLRADHYIFILWFLLSIFLSSFFLA